MAGLRVAALVVLCMVCAGESSGVTPIAKVLKLMGDLLTKSQKGKADEATAFSTFDQWCTNQRKTKAGEITADKDGISKLTAEIEKATVTIGNTDDRIKELEEDVARWNKDTKSASSVRQREKTDFTATNADYQESVEALAGALKTMKKQDFTRAQAQLVQESLLQVQSRHRSNRRLAPAMPAELMNTLSALSQEATSSDSDSLSDSVSSALAESSDALSTSALAQVSTAAVVAAPAAGYEFQSGGVVDMLEKLQTQFVDEKTALEKEELAAQQAYEKMAQQLADNIKGGETELSQKNTLLSTTQQTKADKEGDLKDTKTELEADNTNLKDVNSMCQLKTTDFNSRQQLRTDEITAISKAIDIIGGDAVKGSGDKHLPSFFQKSSVFAHLRSEVQAPMQGKLLVFLNERARTLDSALLRDIAQRVQSGPFTKVKKMVKDLIIKLMEEGTAETEHKGWCDTELTTNQQTRDKKSDDIDKLSSDIEDLTATISKLTQDSADLTASVAELDQAMIDRTNERMGAKKENKAQIKDAKAAISAVQQAIAVLKDFYAQSAEATAFVQAGVSGAPATFDDAYTGNQAEGGGIVDMLEVILSDFTRLDSETTSSEAEEEQAYRDYMFESARDRALKAGQIAQKEAKKTEKESALHSAKVDMKETQATLDKAIKYYEKLKPDCVDSGISYEERQQKQQEEIVSLQEALKILTA